MLIVPKKPVKADGEKGRTLNYYGIASMKNSIDNINSWLYYTNSYLYLEAMEEAENEVEKPTKTRSA